MPGSNISAFRIALVFCLFTLAPHCPGQVVLTEIMFNPAGDESTGEWIEIYNPGDSAVSLSGWQVRIGSHRQALQLPPDAGSGETSWLLAPGRYAVIRDAPYWTASAPADSAAVPDSVPQFAASLTLSNSTGTTVRLLNPAGDTLAAYTYTVDNREGHSDEKILPAGPDTPENWANSLIQSGTPGLRNSVTPRDRDLHLLPDPVWSPDPAVPDSALRLRLVIRNQGLQPSPETTLTLSRDTNSVAAPAPGWILETAQIPPLSPVDSAIVELTVTLPSGRHRLTAALPWTADQDPTDNSVTWTLPVRYAPRSAVINEIMYDPVAGDPEWLEVYNPGPDPVDLGGWTLRDAASGAPLPDTLILPDEGYALLSRSKILDISNISPEFLCALEEFPTLNNGGDRLSLRDATGSLVDTVTYRAAQGGGEGVSLERINPLLPGTSGTNWGSAVTPPGATPGASNSIAAPDYDLALTRLSLPPVVKAGDSVSITALIANVGRYSVSSATVQAVLDRNENDRIDPGEILGATSAGPSVPGDTFSVVFAPVRLPGGKHRILAELRGGRDDNPANDRADSTNYTGYPVGSVLVSEVMYRPESGEPEWVELYVATDSVDLRGNRIRDQGHAGSVQARGRHLYNEGQYVVLSGDAAVRQSYNVPDFPLELVTGFPTLNNGADSVRVLGADGTRLDGFRYHNDWGGGPGISLERRSLLAPGSLRENWGSSVAPAGATPGSENSIAVHDPFLLAIRRADSIGSVQPGQQFTARYDVINHGLDTLSGPELRLGFDANADRKLNPGEARKCARLRQMLPGDSLRVQVQLLAPDPPGMHSLLLQAEVEGNELTVPATLWVPYPRQSLLLNEIYPDPSDRYPAEFVEAVNISHRTLQLDDIRLQVNDRQAETNDPIDIPPGAYLVLSGEDIPGSDGIPILLPDWHPLPNTGGSLRLQDRFGNVLDSLTYDSTWPLEEGRSLERLHLQSGEQTPAVWRTSLDAAGATPGRANSLYLPADSLATGWTVDPVPFSPDGDGIDDLLQIRYAGRTALQYVTIHLYDPAGRLIRSLARDDGAGTPALWVWDGQQTEGDPAPIGVYVLYIEYTTPEGTTRETLRRVILAKPL